MARRDDLTIIYYSSNREKPEFERRIQETLLESSRDIPVVSVTQKPMDFGTNICVGDVGVSGQNIFRQMYIAAMAATTRFVCPTEADYLYPPELYDFVPPRDDVFYTGAPLWVLFAQRGYKKMYCKKPRGSEAFMIANRELLVHRLSQMLEGVDQWGPLDVDGVNLPWLMHRKFTTREQIVFDIPAVTFKTDGNIHKKTPHDPASRTQTLTHWGDAHQLLRRYGL